MDTDKEMEERDTWNTNEAKVDTEQSPLNKRPKTKRGALPTLGSPRLIAVTTATKTATFLDELVYLHS